MKQYKFVLKPLSFYSDIFSADTIFGTVCWYIRYIYGEETLVSMLNDFRHKVPFIISSFIPQGYIARPQFYFTLKDTIAEIEKSKKLKSIQWLPIELFQKYQKDYNQDTLINELLSKDNSIKVIEMRQIDITRNSINRNTGMVLEGILFTDSYYYNDIYYTVYVTEFDESYSDMFKEAFITACSIGLGSDISSGKGVFDVSIKELNETEKKVFGYQGKYFVTLSECAGANIEPVCYTTITKYGKLGGQFSQTGVNGRLLFNKKPIVLYKIGSTFSTTDDTYGVLLNNVHTDPRIVQYAYAYPVYFDYSGATNI